MSAPAFIAAILGIAIAASGVLLAFGHFSSKAVVALLAVWIGGALSYFACALMSIGKNGGHRMKHLGLLACLLLASGAPYSLEAYDATVPLTCWSD
jgi:hypothetical protein